MKLLAAKNSNSQAKLLITAILISVGLWVISLFFPITNYLLYPLQLFATFIHEGSHVLAAVLTGSGVQSLTVSPDTSGVVWTQPSSWLAHLFISSSGYLGTTAFGTFLLVWLRYGFSSRIALYFSSAFVGIMTIVFGLIFPLSNIFSANVTFGSVAFTVLSGAFLSGVLFAVAKYTELKWANFALAFLSVQCLLNSFFSLKALFVISTMSNQHSDAANMAEATGIPSFVWVILWIGISVLMVSIGLRVFAVSQKSNKSETLFEE